MAEDTGSANDLTASSRAGRIHDWLVRPRTVRIVGPAVLLVGVVLVVIGLLVVSPGGDDARPTAGSPQLESAPASNPAQAGVTYPVPQELVEAVRYLVPPVQPTAGFRLTIDSLDVNAEVVQLGLDPRNVPQVPNEGAKVAWYEFSAKPGTGGNAVLAGHVRWAGDPGAFADLDELDEGEVIRLVWRDGNVATYEVFRNFQVDASDPQSLMVMAPGTTDIITLITCAGTFVADSANPLGGDFTDRTVVQARLVEPGVAALSR